MELVKLSNGRLSGELRGESWRTVAARLRRHGVVRTEMSADISIVTVGTERFVKTDDWEGSALISTGPLGDRILSEVASTTQTRAKQGLRRSKLFYSRLKKLIGTTQLAARPNGKVRAGENQQTAFIED
jgi:hypothetical protein